MSDAIPTTVVISPQIAPDFMQWVSGGKLNDSELMFAFAFLLLLRVLALARKHSIDPWDMVVGDDGKLSWSKVFACTSGFVATWVVIHAELAGTLTEWLFNGYLALGVGIAGYMKYLATKASSSLPPG
jgi:hypothetical protein